MAPSLIRQNNRLPSPPTPNGPCRTTAGMPPTKSSMPVQPQRARKSVRTPVWEIPSASYKRARDSSPDNKSPQPDYNIQSRIPSDAPSNTSKAKTPENDLQRARSFASSELTSPMMSPGLRALETSLDENARNTNSSANSTAYDCFNSQPHPRGHFYSANQLFARGVWIGYLAPDRQSESFRGLPSFHDLKMNYTNFSQPHPPVVQGTPRESRNAVCRGCAREDSALIALSEVQFGKKAKVVIMPLDGDDDDGVFAIMLPQKSDRSLHGLQAFRPYEITKDGTGESFVNNFMMLTLRNPDSDAGTLETVLTILPPRERTDIVLKLKQSPAPSKRIPSISQPPKSTDEGVTPRATRATANGHDDGNNAHAERPVSKKRRRMSVHALHKCNIVASSTENSSVHPASPPSPPPLQPQASQATQAPQVPQVAQAPQAPQVAQTPPPINNDDAKPHARMKTESPMPPAQVTRTIDSSKVIPLDLTDEQAERVCFIWTVIDDGIEIELVHTLRECKSFGGLLGLLDEDAEVIPSAASILERTNMWRLTYKLGDGANKAVVARKGTEVAFDRLQSTIAQASIWKGDPNAKVDIELKSLAKTVSG